MSRATTLSALAAVLLGASGCDAPSSAVWPGPDEAGGRWPTWVLADGTQLRPPPPPNAEETRAELLEIRRLQSDPVRVESAEVPRWSGLPTSPWTHEAVDLLEWYWALLPDVRVASPARSARIMALLHVAMNDALVAAWDAKYAYRRPAPFAADASIRALDRKSDVPSYPSEHAAVAAAAAAVLSYAFPMEAQEKRFARLAKQAGEARIVAGMAYPSDVQAGTALGNEVARLVLARARSDGAETVWSGSAPTGAAAWRPTPPRRVRVPFDPGAGAWKTWVLRSGDQFRPPPPPMPGDPAFVRDLEELRHLPAVRTPEQTAAARYWATDAPSAWWELFAEEEVTRRRLSPLQAARAHALISVAMYDAFVACWDAKFHYWLLRPVSFDSTLQTVFSTPPFPSYPSGHSTMSSAAGEVFAYLFPDRASHYRHKAEEASLSRVWGGVHYRFDVVAGDELGRRVGEAVVRRAREEAGGR